MRRRIIEEASRLYHENGEEVGGVETTTVELICERADISVRTFFRHFDSKLDVIYLDSCLMGAVEVATEIQTSAHYLVANENARAYADTGVDYLAVGALTHSSPILDIGLDLREAE